MVRATIWVRTGATVGRTRHAHVVRRRRSRAVGSADSRVVLRSAPAESHSRVANGVALHLVDGHLGGVAVDKLDEAAALARRDLDVGDFSESLEERSKFVLRDIAGKAADENSCVIRIGELVHLSSWVEAATSTGIAAVGKSLNSSPHLLLRHTAAHHRTALVSVTKAVIAAVIRDGHVRVGYSQF